MSNNPAERLAFLEEVVDRIGAIIASDEFAEVDAIATLETIDLIVEESGRRSPYNYGRSRRPENDDEESEVDLLEIYDDYRRDCEWRRA